MPRPVTATVSGAGFTSTETFASKVDADHWRQMMTETLARPELIRFSLPVYAAGLAETVRTYGGPKTREAWLSKDTRPQDWIRGRPLALQDLERAMMQTLIGKRGRPL